MEADLNADLRQCGQPCLPAGGVGAAFDGVLEGTPMVLQVMQVRNVAAPDDRQDASAAPRMLKLVLTDGHSKLSAIELEHLPSLSIDTAPGTKLRLTRILVRNGFALLSPGTVEVLGGTVPELYERWQLQRDLGRHSGINPQKDAPPRFAEFTAAKSTTAGNVASAASPPQVTSNQKLADRPPPQQSGGRSGPHTIKSKHNSVRQNDSSTERISRRTGQAYVSDSNGRSRNGRQPDSSKRDGSDSAGKADQRLDQTTSKSRKRDKGAKNSHGGGIRDGSNSSIRSARRRHDPNANHKDRSSSGIRNMLTRDGAGGDGRWQEQLGDFARTDRTSSAESGRQQKHRLRERDTRRPRGVGRQRGTDVRKSQSHVGVQQSHSVRPTSKTESLQNDTMAMPSTTMDQELQAMGFTSVQIQAAAAKFGDSEIGQAVDWLLTGGYVGMSNAEQPHTARQHRHTRPSDHDMAASTLDRALDRAGHRTMIAAPRKSHWKVGDTAMALYEDDQWYDCVVVSPEHEGLHMVMFTGYDELVSLPVNSLRPRS